MNSTTKRATSFFSNNKEYAVNNYTSNTTNGNYATKSEAVLRKPIILVDTKTPNQKKKKFELEDGFSTTTH